MEHTNLDWVLNESDGKRLRRKSYSGISSQRV